MYHKCCLAACHIPIPKCKVDYLCKNCQILAKIQWNHEGFINTCTSGNFLTVLLLQFHCKQFDGFLLSELGSSTVEDTLKAAISLMMKGKVYEGKTVFCKCCYLLSIFHMTIEGMIVIEVKMTNAFVCSPIYGRLW